MNVFWWLIRDVELIHQIDGKLPDGVPIRIMKSDAGFHVSVGEHKEFPPEAIRSHEVLNEIIRQWMGV